MEKWRDYVLFWGLYLIALILMALRVASRISIRERLKADDYFAFSSFALLSVETAIHTAAVSPYIDAFNAAQNSADFGNALSESPALRENVTVVLRYSFASLIIFWLTVWCVKFSMLFFLRPIMLPIPVYLEGWYIVFGFTVMNLVGCFLIQFFGCLPFGLNFSIDNDSCVSGNSREPGKLYGTTALDTLSDVMSMHWTSTEQKRVKLIFLAQSSSSQLDTYRIFTCPSNTCLSGRRRFPRPNKPALARNLEPCGVCCCGDCGLSSANMGWVSEALEESA
ncbi:hypothetical protein F9C07_4639 [Aspergillus flavus]|uniref:Rhodopsin domain-containing protein n=1 Tax=Aspergillus flavus (strain ATCC 200026 / FGSC A1120 / IAM 13836 / NRRL 3357 / JCM 12722 / SRRC 167) TaxID=332952 RepID=A0A7U2MKZ6_ASPFN|nr:hypothetical protein F9C07_4639 [Aspergillus flavus]